MGESERKMQNIMYRIIETRIFVSKVLCDLLKLKNNEYIVNIDENK